MYPSLRDLKKDCQDTRISLIGRAKAINLKLPRPRHESYPQKTILCGH